METTAILIDDEPYCNAVLTTLLKDYCPEVKILEMHTDPQLGLQSILRLNPDLVFLDIEMPKMNGFQLLDAIGSAITFNLIFCTAYDEFAIKAFRYSALDYLTKPVVPANLKAAVQKAAGKKQLDQMQLEILSQMIKTKRPNKIALPHSGGYRFVEFSSILYCEASGNYTDIHLLNGDTHLVSKTLSDVEEILESEEFMRVHRQYLINLNYVTFYQRGDSGTISLNQKVSVPLARGNRQDAFEAWFESFR